MKHSRSLVVLLTAKSISDIGSALDFICLAVFVWVRTESPLATAMLGLALYGGGMLGGRLGHRYGADWDRRRAMIIADLARMVALAVLALVPAGAQLWWLFPTMIVVGAGRTVFEANLAAATPILAGNRLQTVNSVLSGLRGVAMVAGMGLATVLVPLIGFRGVFALDATTYALSAVVLLALRLPLREPIAADAQAPAARFRLSVLFATGIAVLLAVRGLDALGSASQHVGLPILGDQRDPANPASVTGTVWMVWAAGMLVGAMLLRPLLARAIRQAPQIVFFLATAVMSTGFIGIFWLRSWPAALAAAAVAGFGDALSDVTFKQSIQRLPDHQRVPAFGLSGTVINAGFVIGLVITGIVLTPGWLAEWVLIMHGIPLLAALAAVWSAYRRWAGTPDDAADRTRVGGEP